MYVLFLLLNIIPELFYWSPGKLLAPSQEAAARFNVSGTDELIWGLNDMDSFVGYHRRNNRGKITIDWTGGTSDAIATEILIGGVAGAFVAFLLTLFLFIGCILRANRKPAGDKSSRTSDDVKAVDTPQVDVQMNRA